jgi:hypothetical protein
MIIIIKVKVHLFNSNEKNDSFSSGLRYMSHEGARIEGRLMTFCVILKMIIYQ